MLKALKQAIKQLYPQRTSSERLREELMHQIGVIGGRLFGAVPEGKQRLFYIRDRRTVVWKEDNTTTYYQVTPNGVIRSQNGQPEQRVSDLEAQRLLGAVRWYHYVSVQYLDKLATR